MNKQCAFCGQEYENDWLSGINHLREHVLEGLLREFSIDGNVKFELINSHLWETLYPQAYANFLEKQS